MRKTSLASDTFHHSVGKENTPRSGFGCFTQFVLSKYRGENNGLFVLLSMIQAGPGRTVKQEQEQISRNHVQTFSGYSVHLQKMRLLLYIATYKSYNAYP